MSLKNRLNIFLTELSRNNIISMRFRLLHLKTKRSRTVGIDIPAVLLYDEKKKGDYPMNYNYIVLCVIMIGFDVLTGWIKALKKGKFKSTVMKKGLLSKVTEMIILMLMYVLEYYLPQININIGLPIVAMVGVYIIIMELSSVIENIGAVNPGLQKKLSTIFADFMNDKERWD